MSTPSTGDVGSRQAKWPRRLGCFIAVIVVIAGGAWFAQAIRDAREGARQTQCRSNLGQIYFALINYHDVYGSFPPAYVADADGKPMHSWRVLILPYIDQLALYELYRFDEPWDGPNNSNLADMSGYTFHCASGPNWSGSKLTDYVVIVGADTAFPGAASRKLADITDGAENTILLTEVTNSDIHWMEPRDLNADDMSFLANDPRRPSISSPHPLGPGVVFADRLTTYRVDSTVRPETLRALTTIAGGEPVAKDKLVRSSGEARRLAE